MSRLLLLILLGSVLHTSAQTLSVREKTEAYINTYKELAIQEMIRTGVPAAIKLAQGILESNFGESELARNGNNHFGIKCKAEWTGPKMYHDDDARGECFRVYQTVEASYKDHSDFLRSRPHYASLFTLDPIDYMAWAAGLKKAGYATSNTYTQRLQRVIEDYDLNQYSLQAMARLKPLPLQQTDTITGSASITNEVATADTISVTAEANRSSTNIDTVKGQETIIDKTVQAQDTTNKTATANPVEKKPSPYPDGVFTINHTKVIYANEGISLLALANQYEISLSKLLEFNELKDMDILDTDRLLFIEKKQKKGASDFHVVAEGESIHAIAQKQGIRLENLLEYNQLKNNSKLSVGQQLHLRPANELSSKKDKALKKSSK